MTHMERTVSVKTIVSTTRLALLAVVLISTLGFAQTPPRAARSVHLWYPAPDGIVYTNEVTVEKSVPGSYFCVCGFRHGYFGIQELGSGRKVVIFSVWDPGNQNNPNAVTEDHRVKVLHADDDVRIRRFGNEGTGGQCMFDYDWKIGRPYRCMVKATVEGDRTRYAAFFYLPEHNRWKHLATFQTITGGEYLRGYYCFVEDFRRDGHSARQVRRARYGNGWVRSADGLWQPLTRATFTADNTPTLNIDAGAAADGFFLQTGGETVNRTPLGSRLERPGPGSGVRPPDDPQWKLLWSDEFDTPGLPDPQKWDYEVGFVRNREKQYYTRAHRENARVEDGMLVIEAHKEPYENAEITSASLHTWHKRHFLYGRIEVRAKLPTGRGTWPAIWMLGVNRDKVGWPTCGEIDIMENVGFDPDRIHANIHTQAYNHVRGTNKGNRILADKPYERFHLYALEWYPDHLDVFLDGTKYFTFANEGRGNDTWPFDKPHYLILNLAIGGTWGGQKGIDDAIFPQKYLIDYVRAYESKTLATGMERR